MPDLELVIFVLCISTVFSDNGSPRDSYLDAYQETHANENSASASSVVKNDRQYSTEYAAYPFSSSQPSYQYGPPSSSLPSGPPSGPPVGVASGPPSGPPKYAYGPPLAPVHQYGPPAYAHTPVYAPPAPVPPPPPARPPFHGLPYALIGGLLDKLKWKIDLFIIGKILLKLMLFKKFVSFVAIICLLFFIPWLKRKEVDMPEVLDNGDGGDGDIDMADMMRSLGAKRYSDRHLDTISRFVLKSIDGFNTTGNTDYYNCNSILCKTRRDFYKRFNGKLH